MLVGDLLSDNMFVSNLNGSFIDTYNFNYNAAQNEFSFYDKLYEAIAKCNLVINNTTVADNAGVTRIKGEAKTLRALAYFTLVNYYSATPTSGVNQEYGVPLVLTDYDVNIQPARATVAQVYDQIHAPNSQHLHTEQLLEFYLDLPHLSMRTQQAVRCKSYALR